MNPLFDNAIEFVSDTVRRFYAGAGIEKVTERFTDDFCWIGAGEVEYFTRAEEAVSYMSERAPLAPSCEVFEEEYSLINVKERSCTVMGRYRVRTDPSSGMVLEEHQRCSYELVDAGGSLRICHVHVSNPYQAMKSESYFPFEAGSHNYDYLQQLLREKTETIDLITENIKQGFLNTVELRLIVAVLPAVECCTVKCSDKFLYGIIGYIGNIIFDIIQNSLICQVIKSLVDTVNESLSDLLKRNKTLHTAETAMISVLSLFCMESVTEVFSIIISTV